MDNWHIVEEEFTPAQMHQKETVFTIGNGYLGTRGSFEEGYPGQRPATLIHGLFDDVPIATTELANTPTWEHLSLFFDGQRLSMDRGTLRAYRRVLDMRTGHLHREMRWRSPSGDTLTVAFERFASLADEHILALRCRITTGVFSGRLRVQAALPGHVDNEERLHWHWVNQDCIDRRSGFLHLRTRGSQIELAQAFHLDVRGVDIVDESFWNCRWMPTLTMEANVVPGTEIVIDKLVTVYTSRDTNEPLGAARNRLRNAVAQGYDALYAANAEVWRICWSRSNVTISGDDEADRALRYSLFQLLIAAPRHDERVSVAAKSLSGFGYRGHVFWDTDIFIVPFFAYTQPDLARNLLLYRYHTLPGARRKAQENGYEGAMFAWESATTGQETTPRWIPGPDGDLVRIWCGDIEHHITADVAYAVQQYWRTTGDDAFMRDFGAEIILDTARFWGSRVEWNQQEGAYEINDVIGPDEYHEHVDNNTYTNVLVRWHLRTALALWRWLQANFPQETAALQARLDLSPRHLDHWRHICDNLTILFDPQTRLFEQFEGFFDLKEADLAAFAPRSRSLQEILGIQETQEYQILKQPDVLMLLYLLREEDELDAETVEANWDYYTPRTDLDFGSSLGPSIQSALAAQMGQVVDAYRHFMLAARADLEDVRGNAGDGIHAASAGGLWQAAVFGFAGLRLNPDEPEVNPHLPPRWQRLTFSVLYRRQRYYFDLMPPGQMPRPQLPIRGAIFDLDGVITDTSEYHFLAWKRLADEEGIPFTREDNEALRGISRRHSLQHLLKGHNVSEEAMEEMMTRKNRYYQEFVAEMDAENLLPGARDLMVQMREAGLQIAIGSASKNARLVLNRLDIDPLLAAVADGYSVARAKPAPDLFLHAAAQMTLSAAHCLVLEDASAGVEAARRAGMWTVGIGPGDRVGDAHVILPNFEDVTWHDLHSQLLALETYDRNE